MRRRSRLRLAALVAAGVLGVTTLPSLAASSAAAAPPPRCVSRILVLSAFPTEIGPLLARTKLSSPRPVVVDGHGFYLGRLQGHRVALGLTGIGLANARNTTRAALGHFRCGSDSAISAIVFSGVGGGDFIGDVVAPSRWTEDGKHWTHATRSMLRTMRHVARHAKIPLRQRTPLGDPGCLHLPPDAVQLVTVQHVPTVKVGGNGLSTDPFGGHPFPCVPGAGDVFGCAPCDSVGEPAPSLSQLLGALSPFISPTFFTDYAASQTPPPGHYVDEDMETAAVAKVAHHAKMPFLGIRAASDGGGDPLHLPGFPVEFFVYRQLAADNAAAAALAFLQAWR
ncbi:MAG TPA: hypothetical protein VG708_15265 [Mycobacteriales bacterium]|nr:hypothetical protein [Mycobacteriales bacterium]